MTDVNSFADFDVSSPILAGWANWLCVWLRLAFYQLDPVFFSGVFCDLVEKVMPEIHTKLKEIRLDDMVALSWFLSLFLNSMNFEAAIRIMDLFFFDGAKVSL